jgi:2'-5' RNA ligase
MSLASSACRLFLALWPGEEERRRLAELAQLISGGRPVKPANMHLTLVFLGDTHAERLLCYEYALSDFTMPSLTLTLDHFGYWPKPRILWLGPSVTPLALKELVIDLNQRLEGCEFTPERRPFSPHITLARKFPGPAPDHLLPEPIHWAVNHIALVESVKQTDSTHYQVLRRWPKD